jgi:anthranilate/para-aminobenzoate synthase component II
MKVLVIDNYDSFAYNLVQYLGELGAEVEVVRNDRATTAELLGRGVDRLVVSPGPCTPAQAGISVEAVRAFA